MGVQSTHLRVQCIELNVMACIGESLHQCLKLIRHEAGMSLLARQEFGIDAQVKLPAVAECKPDSTTRLQSLRFFNFVETK